MLGCLDAGESPVVIVDWVLDRWRNGSAMETADPRLGDGYVREEVELVLNLGLLCRLPLASARPSMRQVVQCLDGGMVLREPQAGAHVLQHGDCDQGPRT
jgi:hypothetical protein